MAFLLIGRLGHAESPSDVAVQARAARLFDEAMTDYDQRRISSAIEKLRSAYAIAPSPRVLYNLAQFREVAGAYAESFDSFESYLSIYGSSLAPEREQAVRLRLSKLRSRVTKLVVQVQPASAEIELDGTIARRLATLDPGSHQLRLSADGFRDTTLPIEAEAGASMYIVVTLQREVPTVAIQPVPASVPLAQNRLVASSPTTEPRPSARRYWGPTLVGAATLLAGGAIAAHVTALRQKSAWESENERLNSVELEERNDQYWTARALNADRSRSVRYLQGLELGLLVGAAVAGAAGIGVWVASAKQPGDAAGLVYSGSW